MCPVIGRDSGPRRPVVLTRLPVGLDEGQFRFSGIKVLEMPADGDVIAGEGHERSDFSEGLQDEAPVGHVRMRNDEDSGVDGEVIKVEDIDVDDAGRIWTCTGFASEMVLDGLGVLEEFGGFPDVIEFDHGIEEVGRTFRAVDWFALVDGSLLEMDVVRGEGTEEVAGGAQVGEAITQI